MHVRADLHIHTQASDGDLSPGQVVSLAEYSGLDAIAVTDHDTLSGARDAIEAAAGSAILSIPGVEISVTYDPGTLHILGYFPSFPEGFENVLKRLQDARTVRLPKMIEKLNSLGVDISVSDVTDDARTVRSAVPTLRRSSSKKDMSGISTRPSRDISQRGNPPTSRRTG